MIIVVKDSTKVVLYGGNYATSFSEAGLEFNQNGETLFVASDLTPENCTIETVESIPQDFVGGRYLYFDEVFYLTEDYVFENGEVAIR
ncbi:MAG: hypothetical protein V1799_07740 [bacterium]